VRGMGGQLRVDPILEIVLDGSPKGKGRPRFTKTGHAFTPAATRSYEAALRYAAQVEQGEAPPLAGPLAVEVEARMPVPISWPKKRRSDALAGVSAPVGKPDVDNLLKTVDALNGVVWVDDAQVVDVQVRKVFGEKPALVIRVFHWRSVYDMSSHNLTNGASNDVFR
jgi:Holliday junction resolvase RusA-like endonuclease